MYYSVSTLLLFTCITLAVYRDSRRCPQSHRPRRPTWPGCPGCRCARPSPHTRLRWARLQEKLEGLSWWLPSCNPLGMGAAQRFVLRLSFSKNCCEFDNILNGRNILSKFELPISNRLIRRASHRRKSLLSYLQRWK